MCFVGVVEASVHVPIQYQGAFIGKGGQHVDGLRKLSGCKIEVCLLLTQLSCNENWVCAIGWCPSAVS